MKALILEDEAKAAERLAKLLAAMPEPIEVMARVGSVREAQQWFAEHPAPDVAFFDVRLADGDSFALFERVEVPCPVVFVTAYDEHALAAFRVNAVDYLLKPVVKEDLERAVARVKASGTVRNMGALGREEARSTTVAPVKRFLIRYGDHYRLVETPDIAYIHSLQKNTFLRTREGRDLPLEESLDRLEAQLDPVRFARLNRQLIVQVDSIRDLIAYSKSRLKVRLDPPYSEDAIVSSERAAAFKRWLAGG